MDELEAVWNKTPMPNFQEEPRMLLKTKSVFDPRKVNEIKASQTGLIYIIKEDI